MVCKMTYLKEDCPNYKDLSTQEFIFLHNRKSRGRSSLKTEWLSSRVYIMLRKGPTDYSNFGSKTIIEKDHLSFSHHLREGTFPRSSWQRSLWFALSSGNSKLITLQGNWISFIPIRLSLQLQVRSRDKALKKMSTEKNPTSIRKNIEHTLIGEVSVLPRKQHLSMSIKCFRTQMRQCLMTLS